MVPSKRTDQPESCLRPMIGSPPGPWPLGREIKLSAEESKVSWRDNSIQEVLRKVEFSGLTSALLQSDPSNRWGNGSVPRSYDLWSQLPL